MITKDELKLKILTYKTATEDMLNAINEIFEIQEKLISRLNAYHTDLLMLDYDPYLAFDMRPEISLLKNHEVYDLLGIEPPKDIGE